MVRQRRFAGITAGPAAQIRSAQHFLELAGAPPAVIGVNYFCLRVTGKVIVADQHNVIQRGCQFHRDHRLPGTPSVEWEPFFACAH